MAKQELVATIRDRYQESSKKEKGRILDEFMAVTGHHRKHGIRLLAQTGYDAGKSPVVKGRRIHDEAVREAVIVVWEAADRICGKRLKAALPNLVDSMERYGHLDPQVRRRLLAASTSTLDRLLPPIRATAGSRRKRLSRAARSWASGVSKAGINVRVGVQHKCHFVMPPLYQSLTRREPAGTDAPEDRRHPCIS